MEHLGIPVPWIFLGDRSLLVNTVADAAGVLLVESGLREEHLEEGVPDTGLTCRRVDVCSKQ